MKTVKRLLMAAMLLLGFRAFSYADEVKPTDTPAVTPVATEVNEATPVVGASLFQSKDLTLHLGGRFQELGELEYEADDPLRDKARVYLFDTENRLLADGKYKGIDFFFETAFGGEAYSTSNNQINLLEFDANVPLTEGVSVMLGQFREPANLESADYDANLLFTEKSELMTMFFGMGYDEGIALSGKSGDFDAIVGVEDGAADLPQRYLPEYFNFPPMTFVRLGITDGIKDSPWHPKQTDFEKPDANQFAIHLNGIYLNDSNAGHSTDAALESSYVTVGSATTDDYGNFLLSGEWNPYLGKTAINYGRVTAQYWQTSVDAEFRAPVGDTIFTVQAQANAAQFTASNFAPTTIGSNVVTGGTINIGGGEIQASLGDNPWVIAGRFAAFFPDAGMVNTGSGSVTLGATVDHLVGPWATSILGTKAIYELTLPSITCKVNPDVKIIAEAMWLIDTPEVFGGDGEYVLTEEPSQSSNANPLNPVTRNPLVPVGRMMFQFSF